MSIQNASPVVEIMGDLQHPTAVTESEARPLLGEKKAEPKDRCVCACVCVCMCACVCV